MVVIRWKTDRGMLEWGTSWPPDRTRDESIEEQIKCLEKRGVVLIRPLRAIECIIPTIGGASPDREALSLLAYDKQRFSVREVERVMLDVIKKRLQHGSLIYYAT